MGELNGPYEASVDVSHLTSTPQLMDRKNPPDGLGESLRGRASRFHIAPLNSAMSSSKFAACEHRIC